MKNFGLIYRYISHDACIVVYVFICNIYIYLIYILYIFFIEHRPSMYRFIYYG